MNKEKLRGAIESLNQTSYEAGQMKALNEVSDKVIALMEVTDNKLIKAALGAVQVYIQQSANKLMK